MKDIYVKTFKMLQSLDLQSLIGVKYIPFLLKYRNTFYGQGIKFNKDYYQSKGIIIYNHHHYLYIEIDKNNYDYLDGVIAIIYAYYDEYLHKQIINKPMMILLLHKLLHKDNLKLLYYRNLLIGDILSGYYLKYHTYKCYLQNEFKPFTKELEEIEKYYGYKYYLKIKIYEALNKTKYHEQIKQLITRVYDVKTTVYYLHSIMYMYTMTKKVEELGDKVYKDCIDYTKQLINVDKLLNKELENKQRKFNYNLLYSEDESFNGSIEDYEDLIDINDNYYHFNKSIIIKKGLAHYCKKGEYIIKLNGLKIESIKRINPLKEVLEK